MGRAISFRDATALFQESVLGVPHFAGGSLPSFTYLLNSGLHQGVEYFQVFLIVLGPSTVPSFSVVKACRAATGSVSHLQCGSISPVYFGKVQVEQFSAKLSCCSTISCLPCLHLLTLL